MRKSIGPDKRQAVARTLFGDYLQGIVIGKIADVSQHSHLREPGELSIQSVRAARIFRGRSAGSRKRLIYISEIEQVLAMIAHVVYVEGKSIRQGLLDAKIPVK